MLIFSKKKSTFKLDSRDQTGGLSITSSYTHTFCVIHSVLFMETPFIRFGEATERVIEMLIGTPL